MAYIATKIPPYQIPERRTRFHVPEKASPCFCWLTIYLPVGLRTVSEVWGHVSCFKQQKKRKHQRHASWISSKHVHYFRPLPSVAFRVRVYNDWMGGVGLSVLAREKKSPQKIIRQPFDQKISLQLTNIKINNLVITKAVPSLIKTIPTAVCNGCCTITSPFVEHNRYVLCLSTPIKVFFFKRPDLFYCIYPNRLNFHGEIPSRTSTMDCNAEEKILMIIQGQGSEAKIVS